MDSKVVYQFKVELSGIKPLIWRLIEVPSDYSFWDLHVAIQDSMGWLDYHLHSFSLHSPFNKKKIEIGIPEGEFDTTILPGWNIPINQFFKEPGNEMVYDYDFGDGWSHKVILMGMFLKQNRKKLPVCIDGERACPPEDCGGVPGYYNLIDILKDKSNEDHKEMISWLKHHAKNYHPYLQEYFDPKKIKFTNPTARLKKMMEA